ncbi:unnamed protein product [Rotaria sp. Silwood2]|nr:unnamed protein product [Rotaria sp. Silwood2]
MCNLFVSYFNYKLGLINTALISSVYGVDHVDPQNTSIIVCKVRSYGAQILLKLSRSFMVAACIDRWALTSPYARIRSFCQPKVARNVIIGLILIWPIIPVHMAIFINNYSGRCGAPSYYAFAFSIYLFIFIGILPPAFMISFDALTWHNLKQIRSRVAPRSDHTRLRLARVDRDLIKMLAGEVLVYLVTTVVYPVNTLYGVITTPIAQQRSEMRLAIEDLVEYIVSPIPNYIYCIAPFYGRI